MKEPFLFGFRHDAVCLVVFCIARNDYFVRIGTDINNILCVNTALHAEHADRRKYLARKKRNQAVPYGAALTDAAVHHHDRNMFVCCNTQKVRPNFRFYQYDGLRLDNRQNAVGQIRQIQREI